MVNRIKKRLTEIEKEHNVEILYAIESGSRAWGFESKDSDYDVRFIYKHKLDWYLTIFPKKDTMEYPVDGLLDFAGWDISKTLFLMYKSNPVLMEWLQSPIVYINDQKFYTKMCKLRDECFSLKKTLFHYHNMTVKTLKKYFSKEKVNLKKYFYVLRPLLSCVWIKNKKQLPPIVFEELLVGDFDNKFLDEVHKLLEIKRNSNEFDIGERIKVIDDFVVSRMKDIEDYSDNIKYDKKNNRRKVDELFFELLMGK